MFLIDLLVFLAVLSLLVFFHEFGHFIAAKLCGIYCDRFSLGMPPRIFGFKIGETDYCIGALPIGGYVKMAGQEDVPASDEERKQEYDHVPPERWFKNKPVWQRYIVILAGPLMNLVLAFLLYGVVAAIGAEVPLMEVDNRIGAVESGSAAATAPMYDLSTLENELIPLDREPDTTGWQTGDRIISIEGNEVTNISDVLVGAILGSGKELSVLIERTNPDGRATRYLSPVMPEVIEGGDHARFGVAAYETALVRYSIDGTPAQMNGIQSGDIILRANDKPVDKQTFTAMVTAMSNGGRLDLDIERNDKIVKVSIEPRTYGRFLNVFFSPPLNILLDFEEGRPITVNFISNDISERTSIRKGDEIIRINDQPVTPSIMRGLADTSRDDIVILGLRRSARLFGLLGDEKTMDVTITVSELVQLITGIDENKRPEVIAIGEELSENTGLKRKDIIKTIEGKPATVALLREIEKTRLDQEINVEVERPAILFGLMRKETVDSATLQVEPVGAIGVVWDSATIYHRVSPGRVLPEAVRLAYRDVERTIKILAKLGTGGLSPKDLGGPLLIFQVTSRAAKLGYSWLLKTTAYISVSLCIINLFPLPVLDGGWLVFLLIEAIRKKPLNVKILERIQQAGLVLIIALMLFVTYNDIIRFFSELVP